MLFVPSKDVLVSETVGKLVKNEKKYDTVKQILKTVHKVRIIQVNVEPHFLCSLPNGNLLSCNFESLSLYDKSFQMIKTITKIDTQSIFCFYATTDNDNRIIISNSEENQVIVTDLDLNKIKCLGSYGKAVDQFDYPRGLAYYKSFIYICDYGNKRLQKINKSLEFDKSIELDYCPVQIKIANDNACVTSLFSLIFYNLADFKILFKYDGHNGNISEHNSYFYEYYSYNQKFYCYNRNGQLTEEIQTDGYNSSGHNGCLVYHSGSFVLPSNESKKLIIIDKQN